jgi:hypothetical protein
MNARESLPEGGATSAFLHAVPTDALFSNT